MSNVKPGVQACVVCNKVGCVEFECTLGTFAESYEPEFRTPPRVPRGRGGGELAGRGGGQPPSGWARGGRWNPLGGSQGDQGRPPQRVQGGAGAGSGGASAGSGSGSGSTPQQLQERKRGNGLGV